MLKAIKLPTAAVVYASYSCFFVRWHFPLRSSVNRGSSCSFWPTNGVIIITFWGQHRSASVTPAVVEFPLSLSLQSDNEARKWTQIWDNKYGFMSQTFPRFLMPRWILLSLWWHRHILHAVTHINTRGHVLVLVDYSQLHMWIKSAFGAKHNETSFTSQYI